MLNHAMRFGRVLDEEAPMHASVTALTFIAVALSVGCSHPASPTSPTSGATPGGAGADTYALVAGIEKYEVPFKGRLDGTFTFVPEPAPSTFASVHLDAAGVATHVGRFTLRAPHRVDLAVLPARGEGTFELIAANGDTITGQLEGLGTPTELPDVFSIVETLTVTGGTGRFAGATGSFTAERMVNLTTLVTSGSLEGAISSPGAARP